MNITKININDSDYKIDCKLTLGTIYKCKRQGVLKKDFLKDVLKFGVMVGNNQATESNFFDYVDDEDIIGTVYASYINANTDAMSYDDFLDGYNADLSQMLIIYSQVINQSFINQSINDTFSNEFKKVTPKNKNKNKKKSHR